MRHHALPLTLGGSRRDQLAVHGERRVVRHLAAGEHDRDVRLVDVHVVPGRLAESRRRITIGIASHAQHELRRRGGKHVRRHVRRHGHRGGAEEGIDLPLALGEEERARVLLPDQVLAAESRGPGVVDVRREGRDDVEWADGVDLEEDHDRGLVERHEHVLAHSELLVGVGYRHAFGAFLHRLRHLAPRNRRRVLWHVEGELEVVQPLDGPRPEFERAVLGAHGDRLAPHRGDEHARTRVAGERQRRRSERKVRDRAPGGVELCARDGGRRAGRARRRFDLLGQCGSGNERREQERAGERRGARPGIDTGHREPGKR